MKNSVETALALLRGLPRPTLEELFAVPGRLDRFTAQLDLPGGHILFDWSKTHLDDAYVNGFLTLAAARNFNGRRAALFAGDVVNITERLAAEHTALRGFGSKEAIKRSKICHERTKRLVDAIHGGALGEVRHLIHIGIGGSTLGPALAIDALGCDSRDIDVHFVSNIGGRALQRAFRACDPAATLIVLASKTFTTAETMSNAASAVKWLQENGVTNPYGRVVALTAAPQRALAWGVDEAHVLAFPETVGGRYSLWSSVGFSVALMLGWDQFAAMLEGAAAMDRHFLHSNGADNLPLRAAMADQLYATLRGCQSRAVFVYDERLSLFPSYLQQLEMESNGKGVTVDGKRIFGNTAPVTWGGVGTEVQHAVFQLLHQGPALIPVDFIATIKPGEIIDRSHHRVLLTNCCAQGAALMFGQASDEPARIYPGNRPSATILLYDVNAATLGALIAFHEHRTFANAVLMGINPFDQFGVELGKSLASQIEKGKIRLDSSTKMLLAAAEI